MQRRAVFGTEASSSRRDKSSSLPQDEEENSNVIYIAVLQKLHPS